VSEADTGAPPRLLIVVAAAVAAALVVAVGVFGVVSRGADESTEAATGPLPLVPVPAAEAGSAECASLLEAVPAELLSAGETLRERELAEPAPAATVAWGETEPVVLRCGLDRPPELTRTSQLRVINGVKWLQVPGPATATWYVVDRPVYIALTVPDSAGTGPLQQISDTVSTTLDPVPLRFD
jgi:hypothetical protein